jgi:hypothetical protein
MITIYLSGGLGNQLFQFSAAYSLAKLKKTSLIINTSNYTSNIRRYELDVFENIHLKYNVHNERWSPNKTLLRFLCYLYLKNVFREKHPFKYDNSILNCKRNTKLLGYFQSEKYFINDRDEILNLLNFPPIIDDDLRKLKSNICSENSVSVHVRRGDYVSNPNANAYHGIMPIKYYQKAMACINEEVSNPSFYVFSDDPDWVASNFKFIPHYVLVDINKGRSSFRDLELMSCCKHNIIANSSFSWWGAWLNKNQNKLIIAPKKWVQKESEPLDDLIPDSWRLI